MPEKPSNPANTGRPPSRDELREGNEAATPPPTAHAYGQSAPMPQGELAQGETAAPARPIAQNQGRGRVEDEHDTIDDLADEPMMDDSTSDTDNGRTRGEHLDSDPADDADSELLKALGDVPPGTEDER